MAETTSDDLGERMRLAQDGDRRVYDALLREMAGLLRGRAIRRGIPREHADDVVQETLVSIHHARHTYDPARPFLPWMLAIADHRIADAFRRDRRRRGVEVEGTEALETTAGVGESGEHPLREEIRGALDGLPDRERRVIEMMKVEDRSVREISESLGMSEANVKVVAHRGYRRLRERLREFVRGR